jgi:hypothetical protein
MSHAATVITSAAKKQNQYYDDQNQFHDKLQCAGFEWRTFRQSRCGDDGAAKTELSDNVGEHERDDDDRRNAHQPKNNWHFCLLRDHLDRTHTKLDEGHLVPSFHPMP